MSPTFLQGISPTSLHLRVRSSSSFQLNESCLRRERWRGRNGAAIRRTDFFRPKAHSCQSCRNYASVRSLMDVTRTREGERKERKKESGKEREKEKEGREELEKIGRREIDLATTGFTPGAGRSPRVSWQWPRRRRQMNYQSRPRASGETPRTYIYRFLLS